MFGIPIKYLIVGVLALAVVGAAFKYRADLIEYGGTLYAAKANAAAVQRMKADAERAAKASAELQDKLSKLEAQKNERVTEIVRIRDNSVCDGPSLRYVLQPRAIGGGRSAPPAAGRRSGKVPDNQGRAPAN